MEIRKTQKMFIGGQFVRSESGNTNLSNVSDSSRTPHASIKDVKAAVDAGLKGLKAWQSCHDYLRGQILYRLAENLQYRKRELITLSEAMIKKNSHHPSETEKQAQECIDAIVYYAGFTDKYQQLLASSNPVQSGLRSNTGVCPVGLVFHFASERIDLPRLFAQIASICATGNSLIVLLDEKQSLLCNFLGELIQSSDFPAGSVNILCGKALELAESIGGHFEINAISFDHEDKELLYRLKEVSYLNLKRIHSYQSHHYLSLQQLQKFTEVKTVWNTVGV